MNEAKRLSKIEKELLKKFLAAEKEEVKEPKLETLEERQSLSVDTAPKPLTVLAAKAVEKLKDKLESEFLSQHRIEKRQSEALEKKYEPITKAIKEKADTKPVPRLISSTPKAIRFEDEEDSFDDTFTPSPSSLTPNKSLKRIMDAGFITLGQLATKYIQRSNDSKFGIYFDELDDKWKIGTIQVKFDRDDILMAGERYTGTEGLWQLLTLNSDKLNYTQDDLDVYKSILFSTNAIYQKNDPTTGKPKSSSGAKYMQIIKPIWEEFKSKAGSGLAEYNESPIEYKYVSNLHELIKRLSYIQAQEAAGNNNFHNEKLALVKFLADRLEELVETEKGIKYLVRCISVLPESMIEGSGLFNDFLNSKWMPELHAPGYNFLGPFTRLDKRLQRGDKGINPLDEAAKRHDLFYKDHKDTESRHIADKILQDEAWERVKSKDADLDERLVGLATTGGMWLKRKLGWGLSTSGYMY